MLDSANLAEIQQNNRIPNLQHHESDINPTQQDPKSRPSAEKTDRSDQEEIRKSGGTETHQQQLYTHGLARVHRRQLLLLLLPQPGDTFLQIYGVGTRLRRHLPSSLQPSARANGSRKGLRGGEFASETAERVFFLGRPEEGRCLSTWLAGLVDDGLRALSEHVKEKPSCCQKKKRREAVRFGFRNSITVFGEPLLIGIGVVDNNATENGPIAADPLHCCDL